MLGHQPQPLTMTRNCEANVVLQDIDSFEQAQETMAPLKIPAPPFSLPASILSSPAVMPDFAQPPEI